MYIYISLLFPKLTCGFFVFSSVSARSFAPPAPPLTHTKTHSLTHQHITRTHTHHTLTHSLTHSPTHPPTHSLTHSLTHSFAWLCKGSDVRPGVPWSPVAFAWQVRHLVLCKGSDVRPAVPWSPPLCRSRMYIPWSPPLCRWLLRGRRGTWCSARGRMYALTSLGLRRSAGGFCVAGAALGALQGKGSDVRPGVPWSPPLCRWLLRGRCGTWCSARGRMYPGVPWSPPLCRWLLRGRRGTARGRMYALASLGLRRSAGGFCMAGAALGAPRVGCTPWRPLVNAALAVAFAWQVRHLVLQGSPPLCRWLLRGRRGTWCSARGRMYALASLGLRLRSAWQARLLVLCKGSDVRLWLLRGRCGTWCSARGRMYALASLGLRRSAGGFCVAGAWHRKMNRWMDGWIDR